MILKTLKLMKYRVDRARFKIGMTYIQVREWFIENGWVEDKEAFNDLMIEIQEMEANGH